MEKYNILLEKLAILEYKKRILPFDMLGRTLSYNSLMPRFYPNLDSINNGKNKKPIALNIDIDKIENIIKQAKLENKILNDIYQNSEINFLIINDIYNNEDFDIIDSISAMRALTPFYIIHKSIIFDTYQILESCIAGSDIIALDIEFLRAYINGWAAGFRAHNENQSSLDSKKDMKNIESKQNLDSI